MVTGSPHSTWLYDGVCIGWPSCCCASQVVWWRSTCQMKKKSHRCSWHRLWATPSSWSCLNSEITSKIVFVTFDCTINLTHGLWFSPPNPLATPPAGLSQVWANRSHLLRFCHDTGNLTLTVRQNLRWASEESRRSDILLLRDRLRDEDFLREVILLWVTGVNPNGRVQHVSRKKLLLSEQKVIKV